jgi:hypothetical protein
VSHEGAGGMNQLRLPIKRDKPTLPAQGKQADAGNLEAARIILSDRVKYAGIQVEWAERVMQRSKVVR